jgi:hypothetical protein
MIIIIIIIIIIVVLFSTEHSKWTRLPLRKSRRPEAKFKALGLFRLYTFMKIVIKMRNCPVHCLQLPTYKRLNHCNIICLVYTERREIEAGTEKTVFCLWEQHMYEKHSH